MDGTPASFRIANFKTIYGNCIKLSGQAFDDRCVHQLFQLLRLKVFSLYEHCWCFLIVITVKRVIPTPSSPLLLRLRPKKQYSHIICKGILVNFECGICRLLLKVFVAEPHSTRDSTRTHCSRKVCKIEP